MNISNEQVRSFADHLRSEEKSKATQEKYLRDVNSFIRYANGSSVTKETVVSWKRYLADSGYSVTSVNSMLASVNSFLAFVGLPSCKVKTIRTQRQTYCAEEKELTKTEYIRLLAASKKNEQLNLVLQTICSTGIRISELQYFTVEAIQSGEVTVECKSKSRRVFVPGKLKNILLNYAKRRSITKGAIFVTRTGRPLDRSNIWSAMKRLCATAGVNPGKVFPHNLRKLFARTFYSMEKDIAKLADILGHSSINTTRIYIITTGREHRRKIEKLGLLI